MFYLKMKFCNSFFPLSILNFIKKVYSQRYNINRNFNLFQERIRVKFKVGLTKILKYQKIGNFR